jgi:hypothetical protein
MGEWMYRPTFFLPLHQLEVSSQFDAQAALHQGEDSRIPIAYEAIWASEKRRFFALPEIELQPFGRTAPSQSQYRLCSIRVYTCVGITSIINTRRLSIS